VIQVWYFVNDGKLYEHSENDGVTALIKGLNQRDKCLCSVEDAEILYPSELKEALN